MESLNVLCDAMAKAHLDVLIQLDQANRLQPCPEIIYKEGVRLSLNSRKITSHLADTLPRAIFHDAMRSYLAERDLLPLTAFDLVDWDAI